jgi:hypothetical protein
MESGLRLSSDETRNFIRLEIRRHLRTHLFHRHLSFPLRRKVLSDARSRRSTRCRGSTCVSLSRSSLNITFLQKDRPPLICHLQVSGDAKSLTYALETTAPSGEKISRVHHYERLSGGDGLAGDWRNADPNPSQVLKVSLSQRALTLEFPLEHHVAALPLSGAEVHPSENGAPAIITQAIQFVDPHTFRLANLSGGVVVQRAEFLLSLDGRMITERFWLDKHPEEVAKYTYRRSN